MKLSDNIIEAAHFETMRRVFESIKDDIVDPGVNFLVCLEQVTERIKADVVKLSAFDQKTYFYGKAKNAYQWCQENKAPDDLTIAVKSWLVQQVSNG